MVGAKLPKSQYGVRVIIFLNENTLDAGIATCFAVGVPVMPVSSVDLEIRNTVIKALLIVCDISWSVHLHPVCWCSV